jgi:hypothetical protein
MLFPASVDVGRCQDSFCWAKRPQKHTPILWNDVSNTYTTWAIATSGLTCRHVVSGVGRCRKLSNSFCWIERFQKHIPNLLLNRETPKVCTGLWNDVSINHTTPVITSSGLSGRHVVSGVGQYRLKLLLSCQLTLKSRKDHTVVCKTVTISVDAVVETEFFITSGLRPSYWNFWWKKARTKTALCSPIIFSKSYQTASHYLLRFRSYSKNSGLGVNLPPLNMRGLNLLKL